jgi:hypothetical protein
MFCPFDGKKLSLREAVGRWQHYEYKLSELYQCGECCREFVILDNDFLVNVQDSYGSTPWDLRDRE